MCSKHANLLIVVARKSGEFVEIIKNEDIKLFKAESEETDTENDSYLTLVVDMNSFGVTVTEESTATKGLETIPFARINFSNVRLSKDRILNESVDGRNPAKKLIEHSRLQSSVGNLVLAKGMLAHLLEYAAGANYYSQKLRSVPIFEL